MPSRLTYQYQPLNKTGDTMTGALGLQSVAWASRGSGGTAGRVRAISDMWRGLMIDNGADWIALNAHAVNVLEHGLKNDNSTDNSAALTALFADTTNFGTGTVFYFPEGYYRFRSAVTVSRLVNVRGAGIDSTIFVQDDAGGTTADLFSFNVGGAKVYGFNWGGFTIGATGSDRTAGAALHLGNIGKSTFRDIKITNGVSTRPYNGVWNEQVSDTVFDRIIIEGCNNVGVYLAPPGSGGVIVENVFTPACAISSCVSHGFLIESNADYSAGVQSNEGIHIGAINIFGNGGDAIRLNTTTASARIMNIHLHGAILDTSTGSGLRVEGSGTIRNLVMEDVWSSANGAYGIYLNGVVADWRYVGGSVQLNGTGGIVTVAAVKRGHIASAMIYNNGKSADLTYYGIDLGSTTSLVGIVGCRIYNTTDYGASINQHGINVGANCTDIEIYNNIVNVGASATAINNQAASANRIRFGTNMEDATLTQPYARGLMLLLGTATNNGLRLRDISNASNSKYFRMNGSTLEILNAAYSTVLWKLSDAGVMTMVDAGNIAFGTTTGSQIGTSSTQKLAFYGATAIVRPSVSAAATDATTTQTLANSLRTVLINLGLAA